MFKRTKSCLTYSSLFRRKKMFYNDFKNDWKKAENNLHFQMQHTHKYIYILAIDKINIKDANDKKSVFLDQKTWNIDTFTESFLYKKARNMHFSIKLLHLEL